MERLLYDITNKVGSVCIICMIPQKPWLVSIKRKDAVAEAYLGAGAGSIQSKR